MDKKIITTVGTSLLDKARKYHNNQLSNYDELKSLSYYQSWQQNLGEYGAITDLKSQIKTYLEKGNDRENASAEIKSLVKIQEQENCKLEVYLICTDTILSVVAADMVKEWFNKNDKDEEKFKIHFNPQIDVIKDLQIDNVDNFKKGLLKLNDRFYQITQNEILGQQYKDIIINITGGYKGLIPFISLLGQINQSQIKYIFEETDVIITIPNVPIRLDETLFEKYWETLEKLEQDVVLNINSYYQMTQDLESCFELDGNDFSFNYLGLAFWQRYKSKFFIFYSPDECWSEIQNQQDITRILQTKLCKKDVRNGSKNEQKGDKRCYDDGNNNNRIYNLEQKGKFYVYKTFQNEEKAKEYITTRVDFDEIVKTSKARKLEIQTT